MVRLKKWYGRVMVSRLCRHCDRPSLMCICRRR